jgi:hypothetical protein
VVALAVDVQLDLHVAKSIRAASETRPPPLAGALRASCVYVPQRAQLDPKLESRARSRAAASSLAT